MFSLPPSGHTYSYPGMMPDPMQSSFVQSTNTDCDLLLARSPCSATVICLQHSALQPAAPLFC